MKIDYSNFRKQTEQLKKKDEINIRKFTWRYWRTRLPILLVLLAIWFIYQANSNKSTSDLKKLMTYSTLYKSFYVWQDNDTGKIHVSYLSRHFDTIKDAMMFIDQIEEKRKNYTTSVNKNLQEYKTEVVSVQSIQNVNRPTTHKVDQQVTNYFQTFDTNKNGKLDWGEIQRFQLKVYEDFKYTRNQSVLSPEEFFKNNGGDCDDFAAFSAAFLEHFGYPSFVLTFSSRENPDLVHAVSGLYIGNDTYRDGYRYLSKMRLFNPKRNIEKDEYAPEGNYVIIDFWKVGDLTDSAFDTVDRITRLGDVIDSPW